MPFQIVAVSGSLRANSSNTGLLKLAQRVAPSELNITIVDIADLPFYNADLDTPETVPAAVTAWRDAVANADALILATPEYNYGMTAVQKNAVDWASRPMGSQPLRNKVVSVMASGGKGGARKVQAYVNEVLGLFANTLVNEPEISLAVGFERLSGDGQTSDPEIEALVRARLANLVAALS